MSKSKKSENNNSDNKILNTINKGRFVFKDQIANLKTSGTALVWTVVATFFVMLVICLAVFLGSVQGAEKVMVPDVVGSSLTNALLKMQEKQLYAQIQLKYSDNAEDAGYVLEQTPDAESIVKAYRRVTLTVSRGLPLDEIEDYTGKSAEETKKKIDLLYSGEDALITVAPFVYQRSTAKEGTIIAQYPPEGTVLTEPVKLHFVVSGGETPAVIKVPDFKNATIEQCLKILNTTDLKFNFLSDAPDKSHKNGTVIGQNVTAKTEVNAWSELSVVLAIGEMKKDAENVYGIFKYDTPSYPFPVEMRLVAIDTEGKHKTLASFHHNGPSVTIPYDVQKGSTLKFYILGDEKKSITVQ